MPVILRVYGGGVAASLPWELGQAPLFAGVPTSLGALVEHCAPAALGDGLLLLLVFGIGLVVFRDWAWGAWAGMSALLFAAGVAAGCGVLVEVVAVRWLGRWQYDPAMPLIPVLRVGVVPVLQLPLLSPVVIAWATRRI